MICIYSQNNTEYTKNGDAVLIPTKCELQMTINGAWQLTLEHPYDEEERYKYIIEGAVVRCDIKCIRELPTVQQLFRIYTYTKGLHGITAIGFPVAMESTYDAPIDNLVISGKTGAQAMAAIQAFTNKYTLSTTVTKTASASLANTNVNSAIANVFLSTWGGEILYSNYDYMVKDRLGDNVAADHQIIYGRNLTSISYKKDDSGLTTRIYPISQDGIRLNGTGYVDSPHAEEYPVIHHRFMTAPYSLIDTNASSASATAQKTAQALSGISTAASTLSHGVDISSYPPEYIKTIRNDIISAVQTMALTGVISTSYYEAAAKTIANAMAWMNDLAQPDWDWMGSYQDGWKYGDANGYAVNEYIKIGKKWSYFGQDGNWQEPADSSNEWQWYQPQGSTGRKYGDYSRYYAHNEFVFITVSGELQQYWFDKQGWLDSDKSGASDYAWNGSGTAADPWWFGESSTKYLKSCWAFIDGTYYFFDEFGYYDGSTKLTDYQWDWVDDGANPWFGNPDESFAAFYLHDQWCKIDGEWYYFDSNGYVVDTNASRAAVVSLYTTGMASLATTVSTWGTELYTLLYSLMTAFCQSKYDQGIDVPVITITVNMADLSKTTEYAGYENLETIKLGDSVTCIDNEHNISTTNRVIGLTYDCIRDYNSEVVIGSATASVASIVGNANGQAVAGGFDTSAIEAQISALQSKVGEVMLNGSSVVTSGVAQIGILAGQNIEISRSGHNLTISAQGGGGTGDVNLYHGINEPAASIGQNDDIYVKMKADPTSNKGLFTNLGGSGHSSINYYPDIRDYALNFWGTFYGASDPSWLYFICSHMPIEQGKKYRISFWLEPENTPQLSETNDLFGVTVQTTSSPLDVSSFASELVTNGEFQHITNHGDFYYQSFYNDGDSHHYTFDFEPVGTSLSNTAYFGIYFNRLSENLPVAFLGWTITELTEGTEVEEVYYKIEGSWRPYNGKNYLDLINKPKINGVELTGNKSTSDLQIDYDDLIDKPTLATVATTGDYDDLTDKPSLATVATSGSYTDLTDKPTIPAAQVNSDWNASSGVAQILNKPTLATVATTGDYDDLTDKPNIPDIVANGSGTASTNLTKLKVNSTIYNVQNLPLTVQNGKLCIIYDNGQ